MNLTTSDGDTNPGRSAAGKGPTWASGLHDDLKLPSGRLVGQVNNEELRAELARIGIDGAHVDGRHILCARYAACLQKVFNDAGSRAVQDWLTLQRK